MVGRLDRKILVILRPERACTLKALVDSINVTVRVKASLHRRMRNEIEPPWSNFDGEGSSPSNCVECLSLKCLDESEKATCINLHKGASQGNCTAIQESWFSCNREWPYATHLWSAAPRRRFGRLGLTRPASQGSRGSFSTCRMHVNLPLQKSGVKPPHSKDDPPLEPPATCNLV